MKSLKIIISSIFLALFVFIAPQKTSALTIEEIINDISSLQPVDLTYVKDTINYDYQKNIEEISSILDESLISSKDAYDNLVELNTLMDLINEDNKALLTIEDKKEYDESVAILKEKIEAAKEINTTAKNSSQSGLDKYNEALEKYAILKVILEEEQKEAEEILNTNIGLVNTKLDVINDLLEELTKIEDKLKEAYDEANSAYESAKENANDANSNFSDKLEELKEYVEVNGEQELNELIKVNTDYIASGVLYATSQVALKLIDMEIELVEKEIASLEADKALLDEQLLPYEEVITEKENELANLNTELNNLTELLNNNGKSEDLEAEISDEQKALQLLIDAKNNKEDEKETCSKYIDDLKAAIAQKDARTVIELLFENEQNSKFLGQDVNVTIEEQYNSNYDKVNFVVVTDEDNKKHYYSYEESNGVITIYEQNFVDEHDVNEMPAEFAIGKYLAYVDETNFYSIYNIEINDIVKKLGLDLDKLGVNLENLGLKGFQGFVKDDKYYAISREGNSWVAVEKTLKVTEINLGIVKIPKLELVNGAKITINIREAAHFEKGQMYGVDSQEVINKCDAITTDSIESNIKEKEDIIKDLKDKLTQAKTYESQIAEKNTEIATKKDEVKNAKDELQNQKETLTNASGMTYSEIEAKLAELDEKLNEVPSVDDLFTIGELTNLVNEAMQGNVDIQAILDTINNLNISLNAKKSIVSQIDTVLANNYNNAKQELIEVAGEDLEKVSNILKEIAPVIKDVAESNLKLLEEKAKYELAESSYNALLDVKELVLGAKEEALNELEELEQLKEDNKVDLSDLDAKLEEAKEALISVNNEVEVAINDYVIVEDEEVDTDTKPDTETDEKEESTLTKKPSNKNDKEDVDNKEEEKEENTTPEKEESKGQVFDPVEEFNWFNLLWLLPIGLIIFFIILVIKRKKDEE